MRCREASINGRPIAEVGRKFFGPLPGARPADQPGIEECRHKPSEKLIERGPEPVGDARSTSSSRASATLRSVSIERSKTVISAEEPNGSAVGRQTYGLHFRSNDRLNAHHKHDDADHEHQYVDHQEDDWYNPFDR
jgi:hypothetical protein